MLVFDFASAIEKGDSLADEDDEIIVNDVATLTEMGSDRKVFIVEGYTRSTRMKTRVFRDDDIIWIGKPDSTGPRFK